MMNRERLMDPDAVADYFLTCLRPRFAKGAQTVYLCLMVQFMRTRQSGTHIQRWITRFALLRQRVGESRGDHVPPWMMLGLYQS
eukprot:12907066-Prorocentrum_lima.AAC.1